MSQSYPTIIPGLRSPFDQVKGIVYFGRMLDKIRLATAGKLPEGWESFRGVGSKGSFDSWCCRFLQIDYATLEVKPSKAAATNPYWNGPSPMADSPVRMKSKCGMAS